MVGLEYLHKYGGDLYGLWSFRDLSTYTPDISTGKISLVRDKSYYANYLVETSALKQPTALATGLNGKPCVSFDGSGQCMVTKNVLPCSRTSIITVVLVLQNQTAAFTGDNGAIIIELSSNNNNFTTGFYVNFERLNSTSINGLHSCLKGNSGLNSTAYNSYFFGENQILIVELDKTKSNPEIDLYKDNQQLTKQAGFNSNNSNAFGDHKLYVAARNENGLYFKGLISDLGVIGRGIPLSEKTDIARDYANKIGLGLAA